LRFGGRHLGNPACGRTVGLRWRFRGDQSCRGQPPDGGALSGSWAKVGASHIRIVYAIEIVTTAEQDAALIGKLNNRSNSLSWPRNMKNSRGELTTMPVVIEA
jgi:hypothetical protein